MAGHSRPKDGVASVRLCPGHPRLGTSKHERRGCPGQARTSPGMTNSGVRRIPSTALQSRARSVFAMAMTVELSAPEPADAMASRAPSGRLRRYARPALGLLLPVGLALAWEIIVRLGLSTGRLVPPPTKLFATIVELARSGELTRHILATLTRVVAGFGLGVVAGTVLGAVSGYWAFARPLLGLPL